VDALEERALERRNLGAEPSARDRRHHVGQLFGDDDDAVVVSVGRVVEVWMKRDRQIRRNRPRRRRPDEHATSRPASAGTRGRARPHRRRKRELDVDRRRRVRLVLDLGFGQRRAVAQAPVDRLLALVDEPRATNSPSARTIAA
jgi:hypothetical protein